MVVLPGATADTYTVDRKKHFSAMGTLEWTEVQVAFDFAFNMTFGKRGQHRDHRSGGSHNRKQGEIFKDTFQGKISELALRKHLSNMHDITLPGRQVWKLGEWDEEDFTIDGKRVSVKSTKAYGQLLLLEAKDYDEDGRYLPNKDKKGQGEYDYFVLVRMKPFCEEIMKSARLLYSNDADYNELMDLMEQQEWEYDIPGYIKRDDFRKIIAHRFIIPRGALLNGKIPMDADNYYVQAGDLRSIDTL